MRNFSGALCAVLFASGSVSAQIAQESVIGTVKKISGVVTLTWGGLTRAAAVGSTLYAGTRLNTQANSSVGVTFKDDTVISLGSDTDLTIDDYVYLPARNRLKFSASLSRGSLNYVSGVIAKLQPEAINIRTPTAFLGVRGTRLLVKVDESAP